MQTQTERGKKVSKAAIPHWLMRTFDGKGPRIVCFTEKHGSRYFIVNSLDEFADVCVRVLKERLADGYYEPEELTKKPAYMRDQAEQLLGSAKEAALKEINEHEEQQREYLKEKEAFEQIKKGAKGDKLAAMESLRARQNYEYEGWEIIRPEDLR